VNTRFMKTKTNTFNFFIFVSEAKKSAV